MFLTTYWSTLPIRVPDQMFVVYNCVNFGGVIILPE